MLLVEPDEALRARLVDVVRSFAEVEADVDFLSARAHLFSKANDWLVTNIRLSAYNGLHLVHLASSAKLSLRTLVYAQHADVVLAREAQRAGAFYEPAESLPVALPAYLWSLLPDRDRRAPELRRRRALYRGGRRSTDSVAIVRSFA